MTLLRKYALWLLLAALAGTAGAWLIHASLPVRYVSTAEVDVEPSAAAVAANWAPSMVTASVMPRSSRPSATTVISKSRPTCTRVAIRLNDSSGVLRSPVSMSRSILTAVKGSIESRLRLL